MAIVGSPRIGGNTDLLADAFLKGAAENGHNVTKFHLGKMNINGCLGCDQCFKKGGRCIQDDDMQQIYPVFDKANVVAWASPLYIRQFSARMKAVIDRLHSLGDPTVLSVPVKECALLVPGGSDDISLYAPIIEFYQFSMIHYTKWKDLGMILALGAREKGEVKKTDALQRAYDLGKSL